MIHYVSTHGIGDAWIANELHIVREAGIPTVLHAMRPPHQVFFTSDWANELAARTRLIYPLPPLRFAGSAALAPFRFGRRFWGGLTNALFGPRESARARFACLMHFFVACHWAAELRRRGEPVSLIHAQWVHAGASIGMYGAWLLGVPFSFTGHAADLSRDRVALVDKIRRAAFIGCISEFHRSFYKRLGGRDEQFLLVYCGIDPTHFRPREKSAEEGDEWRPVHILSSARLVPKKGLSDLVEACRLLIEQGRDIRCTIAGAGPLEPALRRQIAQAGIGDRVQLTGQPLTQEEIPRFMHTGDLYCLPCVQAEDGDIDGLPQMLMEAMACGLPSVSTRVAGIPELLIDDQSGLLVEPNDPPGLANALGRLIDDPKLAERLGRDAARRVRERFEIKTCVAPLIDRFRLYLAGADRPRPPFSTVTDSASSASPPPALSRS